MTRYLHSKKIVVETNLNMRDDVRIRAHARCQDESYAGHNKGRKRITWTGQQKIAAEADRRNFLRTAGLGAAGASGAFAGATNHGTWTAAAAETSDATLVGAKMVAVQVGRGR